MQRPPEESIQQLYLVEMPAGISMFLQRFLARLANQQKNAHYSEFAVHRYTDSWIDTPGGET
jgi:hypothetical protein